jgi:hypothetical protein
MPKLRHLIEELKKLSVDPDEVCIPGQLYDDLMDQGEDIADEEDDGTIRFRFHPEYALPAGSFGIKEIFNVERLIRCRKAFI